MCALCMGMCAVGGAAHMLRLDLSEDTGRGAVVLRAVGEVDIASAPELEDSVNRALTLHRPLVLDLERISFMDASGLRVLALANRLAEKMGAPLTLLRPSRQVLRVLAITGMLDTFVAAMIIGHTRDAPGSPVATASLPTAGPHPSPSNRLVAASTVCPCAATGT